MTQVMINRITNIIICTVGELEINVWVIVCIYEYWVGGGTYREVGGEGCGREHVQGMSVGVTGVLIW